MIDISVSRLEKFYGDNHVLKDISFDLNQGEKLCIVGDNGTGKTTLFNVIVQKIPADGGQVSFAAGKRLGLVEQLPVVDDSTTVDQVLRAAFAELYQIKEQLNQVSELLKTDHSGENMRKYDQLQALFELRGGWDSEFLLEKCANGLNISQAMRQLPYNKLSGGERTRVSLARVILQNSDILLLDEPTNHLDLQSIEWLEDYLDKFKGTVLLISHDRYFLDKFATKIMEIKGGQNKTYTGNYTAYMNQKREQAELEQQIYEKQQKKIAQLSFTAQRMRGWGLGNKKVMRRAFSIEKRIERIGQPKKPDSDKKPLKTKFSQLEFKGDEILYIGGLSKAFGDREILSDLNLSVFPGDRIALMGANGAGKSTLLKILSDEVEADAGDFEYAPSVCGSYLPQIIEFGAPERNCVDTLLYALDISVAKARDRLGAFDFKGDDVFKQVKNLSGGEKARLKLCMLMDEELNFLVLDEPTNHLDISSREWIENAISDYGGAMIFVSHDRYFIDKFSNRVWSLEDGKITDFKGSYAQFAARRAPQQPQKPAQKNQAEPKAQKSQKSSGAAVRKAAAVEREIGKIEQQMTGLDEREQEVASDFEQLNLIIEERKELEAEWAQLYEKWQALLEE